MGKGFIDVLNEDLVSFIVDWRENNCLRPDRKADSIYRELLLKMRPDEKLVEKKQRSDLKEKLPQIVDKKSVQSMDGQWTAEYSVVENSIEKYSIEECKATLEKEKLTQKEYNELLQKYNKDLVDDVIQRIIEHPYVKLKNGVLRVENVLSQHQVIKKTVLIIACNETITMWNWKGNY
ncbi:hypothetical protein C8E03_103211 [Lachnotalea glycerini]|uniref:Uncharacterized protein n=1 Tax=Lachnotalea glycerini TaxID=1763509 RepID=A0A318ENF1_9FIRM|nr:hypothetical protein [Lachnotalea glycerini]OYO76063.1 hypothetical protein CG709_16485 [Lachnotalea glycerini]PXV91653.1 hypothetical protein C8E03_103211 [Lachnotalea glycerini]